MSGVEVQKCCFAMTLHFMNKIFWKKWLLLETPSLYLVHTYLSGSPFISVKNQVVMWYKENSIFISQPLL